VLSEAPLAPEWKLNCEVETSDLLASVSLEAKQPGERIGAGALAGSRNRSVDLGGHLQEEPDDDVACGDGGRLAGDRGGHTGAACPTVAGHDAIASLSARSGHIFFQHLLFSFRAAPSAGGGQIFQPASETIPNKSC